MGFHHQRLGLKATKNNHVVEGDGSDPKNTALEFYLPRICPNGALDQPDLAKTKFTCESLAKAKNHERKSIMG